MNNNYTALLSKEGLLVKNLHKLVLFVTFQVDVINESIIMMIMIIIVIIIIKARRSDIVLIDKKNQEIFIIHVAISGYFRVRDKEAEKISKYQYLALEIFQMWNTKTRVIPLVIIVLAVLLEKNNKLNIFTISIA